jgi:hypothetical protein
MRFSILCLCAAAGLAQSPKEPPKPPADVDAALRARVTEFFQYHVTGQFRKGEALVADDSKELYYNRNKPRYLQLIGIERVDWSENFTKAMVTVMVVSPEVIPGWVGGPPQIPIPSTWKLENGKWCWYVQPDDFLRTPFGNFSFESLQKGAARAPGMLPPSLTGVPPGAAPKSVSAGDLFPAGAVPAAVMPAPAMPVTPPQGLPAGATMPDPGALAAIAGARQLGMSPAGIPGGVPPEAMGHVKLDHTSITLKPGQTETVTFSNEGSESRNLLPLGTLAGIDTKIDHADLPGGGRAVLTVHAGKDAKSGVLSFVIPQTAEMFSVQVSVEK